MFEKINFSMNKVYPTLVVSTMSSGKSTLINALVGTELLPAMNQACTARAVAILDNDKKEQFEIHAVDKDGKYSFIPEATKEVVEKFNNSNDVSEMLIEGEIQGIRNSKKSLLLIDTPGINNSLDSTHASVTKNVLDDFKEGLLIYIINAQQMATYDDSSFLGYVAKKITDNPNFSILFVLNKVDQVDPEMEEIPTLINNCKKYITKEGINEPMIIPISAGAAMMFKKVLAGVALTNNEQRIFLNYYDQFKSERYSLQDYAHIPNRGNLLQEIEIHGDLYSRADIYSALENTGIPLLEKKIDEMIVKSSKLSAPKITINKETKTHKNTKSKKGAKKKCKKYR